MRGKTGWWIRQAGLLVVSGFYLYFGIRMLVGAYGLDNPLTFIITFFASNLIILISAALIVGFIYRMVVVIRRAEPDTEKAENDPVDDKTRNP